MNRIIGIIITATVIVSILALAGCVGKEPATPTATPLPTSTPEQVVSTPAAT